MSCPTACLRLRKEESGDFQYSGGMDTILDANWTVAQVMDCYPETARAFIRLKTDCVGCPMMKFCTLSEAARAYDLPLERLLQELHQTIQASVSKGECV